MNPKVLYNEAQKADAFKGEDYDGTTVRAGAKILQQEGFIKSYRWTYDVNELAIAVLEVSPVVVGTTWYSDMFTTEKNGLINIGGRVSGGHAYEINGVNTDMELFRIKNSWNRKIWGKNGFGFISFRDMQTLLNDFGECCLAEEIKKSY